MAERPAMRRIDAIRVGVRHRRDLGDLASLAKSIGEVGLLHPIVVCRDGRLIAGERRLEAFKLLGRTEIPATVVDLEEVARGELAENADRKDFLPSEIDAICRALEPREKAAAKARETLGKISPGSEAGRTRDCVGAFAGVSGRDGREDRRHRQGGGSRARDLRQASRRDGSHRPGRGALSAPKGDAAIDRHSRRAAALARQRALSRRRRRPALAV